MRARAGHWVTRVGQTPVDLESIEASSFVTLAECGGVDSDTATMLVVLGDTHGHLDAAERACLRVQHAFQRQIDAIFQVGDFGYWPEGSAGEDPFYKEEDAHELPGVLARGTSLVIGESRLDRRQAPLHFIRGNHEDFVALARVSRDRCEASPCGSELSYLPDGFRGEVVGVSCAAVGGILRDLSGGRGRRAKQRRKAARVALDTDPRFSDSGLLDAVGEVDLLLTHSGPDDREERHGSRALANTLRKGQVTLHFYGHHHRHSFAETPRGVSVGLRNLAARGGALAPGALAIVLWRDRSAFRVLVHQG
ncbi:MAG: metallophosphoesterase [Polyangiaceae bacterium]